MLILGEHCTLLYGGGGRFCRVCGSLLQLGCLIWLLQSGECALADANATIAQMAEAVRHVRRSLPAARLVLQGVLPKGDYWPNRCSPAIDAFNGALQVSSPT